MTNKNSKKGFTIIEVVLVLAIAGLIFLMVFIALPALQRSQRNTRRRQDMSRILSAFNDYQANNNGKMPQGAAALSALVNKYVTGVSDYSDSETIQDPEKMDCSNSDQFCDPDGTSYYFKNFRSMNGFGTNVDVSGSILTHEILYLWHAKCGDDEGQASAGKGDSEIAILYQLEGGAYYCGDNQ